jgi:hypothetical protein
MTVCVNGREVDRARENMAYVRRLLWHKQPGFAAALESAVLLAERELSTTARSE